ncbi:MAG: rhomboid family intramembrane serine protease [Aerococcaceae bacterium]|nr:rhomboid family intramembrane serine protease [Aerococcaceae bacterium]
MKLKKFSQQPLVIYTLLLVMGIVYAFMMFRYGTTENTLALIQMGGNFRPMIVHYNEWWRLLTAGFLHIGLEHLLLNGVSIYFMGQELESLMGHWRLGVLFIVSVIGGNLAAFALNSEGVVSAGASTGLFGLFTAMLVLAYLYPESSYLQYRSKSLMILIIMNFLLTFSAPDIDLWGHAGGVVYGAFTAFVLGLPHETHTSRIEKLLAVAIIIAMSIGLVCIGITKV